MKPPKWYSGQEIKEWLNRRGSRISIKNAEWLSKEFQKAFNKGWEKGVSVANYQQSSENK